jgi:hypothetical protein
MKVHVYYDRHGPLVVETAAELDRLLDQIAATPEYQKDPVLVDVSDETEQRVLEIGLGYPDFSMLLWFDWTEPAPEAYVSAGTVHRADFGGYNHGGTWTEYDPGCVMPVGVARQAVRDFFERGTRPTSVAWRGQD